MARFLRALLVLSAATAWSVPQPTVALTFDDLPGVGFTDAADARAMNQSILAALRRHHAPAMGFVNGQTTVRTGRQVLRPWTRDGFPLGSHTYSHLDLNDLTFEQFQAEVIRNEPFVPGRSRYLRFPFNHTGDTPDKLGKVAAFLRQRGYRVATCTIENEDYIYAKAYDAAVSRHDDEALSRLKREYLAQTAAEIDYYSSLHVRIFGHAIPHIMLLHVNHLNAALIDPILRLFEQRDYRFVTLDEAQSDPAYATPITASTRFGPMWAYRWAGALGIKVDGRLEPEASAWVRDYAGKASGHSPR